MCLERGPGHNQGNGGSLGLLGSPHYPHNDLVALRFLSYADGLRNLGWRAPSDKYNGLLSEINSDLQGCTSWNLGSGFEDLVLPPMPKVSASQHEAYLLILEGMSSIAYGVYSVAAIKLASASILIDRIFSKLPISQDTGYQSPLFRLLESLNACVSSVAQQVSAGRDNRKKLSMTSAADLPTIEEHSNYRLGYDPSLFEFLPSGCQAKLGGVAAYYDQGIKDRIVSVHLRFTGNGSQFYQSEFPCLAAVSQVLHLRRAQEVMVLGSGNAIDVAVFSHSCERVKASEIDPFLFEEGARHISALASGALVDPGVVQLHQGDFFLEDWSTSDFFYLYWPFSRDQSPSVAARISAKLKAEGKPGACLAVKACHQPEFPGLQSAPVEDDDLQAALTRNSIRLLDQ